MPDSLKISRWNTKPPLGCLIDWSNPINRMLVGCWILNKSSHEEVNKIPGALINSAYYDPEGVNFSPTNAGLLVGQDSIYKFTSEDITIIVKARFDAALRSYSGFVSKRKNTGTGGWSFLTGTTGNKSLAFTSYDSASRVTYSANNVIDINQTYTLVARKIGTSIQFFINGIPTTMGSIGVHSTITYDAEYDLYIGRLNDANENHPGSIHYCYIFKRALTNFEIQSLYIDPYQIYLNESLSHCARATTEAIYKDFVGSTNVRLVAPGWI